MCWINGKTRQNIIKNDTIGERVGIALIVVNMIENRLRLVGRVEKTCRYGSTKSRSDGRESDQKR